MLLPELAQFLADNTSVAPVWTIRDHAKELRAHGLLSLGKRGRNGGVPMTSGDAINLTLACTLRGARGESIALPVQRLRALPVHAGVIEIPDGFTRALSSFGARNAGEALDNVLNDMRANTFRLWSAGADWGIRAYINPAGNSVHISIVQPASVKAVCGAALSFGPGFDKTELVSRTIILNADYFRRVAMALGPP